MNTQMYTGSDRATVNAREVSLKKLLFLTLRRWRSMLLAGLVLAVLLAGMKVVREYKNRSVSNVAHEEYLAAMEIYNASVESYSTAIERFQTKIDAKQKYFNESLLMQIDPHNESVSSVSLVVNIPGTRTDTSASAEPEDSSGGAAVAASNVLHAYTDFINSSISYSDIAGELGVPEQSVRELVIVTTDQYHFSGVFKVSARSMDMELSKKILDHVLRELEDNRASFVEVLGEHTVEQLGRNEETVVDTTLLQQQTELQNSIVTLQKNLQTSQTSLKELVKPTEATGASTKTIIKHGIKYGVAGMVGGIFLVCLLCAIGILLRGQILTDDELYISYGVRTLITFPRQQEQGNRRFLLDRLVDRLTKDHPEISLTEAGDILIAKVENELSGSGSGTVVLTGSIEEARLESLAAALNRQAEAAESPVHFTAASNVTGSARAVRSIQSADACIIVEELGVSSFREASLVTEQVLDSRRPVLGTVYL